MSTVRAPLRRSSAAALAVAFVSVSVAWAGGVREASATGQTNTGGIRLRAVELAAEDPMPGGTFVLVENSGSTRVGIGCWRIRTSRAVLAIRRPLVLPSRAAVRLFFDRGRVNNPDRIRLLNPRGRVVDATPLLHDKEGDDRLFTRTAAGWSLGRASLPARVIDGSFVQPGTSGC